MSVDLSVESDLKSLRRGLSALEKQAVPQATVRTLNRMAESAKVSSARHIAPQMGGRLAAVKRRIETRPSTFRRLWAALVASERPLHLIEFVVGSKKPTQQPGGKRGLVKAKAWGKKVAETTKAVKALNKQQEEAQRIFEATRTPLERYNKEMAQLNALLEKGYINQDTFGRAVEQANEKLGKATKQTGETIEGEFSRIGETMEGTIDDSLDASGGRFDGFGDFFKGFLSDLNRTLLQYALKDLGVTGKGGILDGLFGSIGGLFGGGGSGGGGGFGDFFGGFFADGGRLSPGKFGIVGERGPELAYAGNAPMHIMPDMGMSAAPITINMNVQTPDVRSFKQSQSQIAADMARSIERARRNL